MNSNTRRWISVPVITGVLSTQLLVCTCLAIDEFVRTFGRMMQRGGKEWLLAPLNLTNDNKV